MADSCLDPLRRTLRIALWGALVAWLVFAVLVLALRFVVLPNVGVYHERIEQALSQAVGQPVTIGRIEARWQGLNPDLVLDQVVIADRHGKPAFCSNRWKPSFPGGACGGAG